MPELPEVETIARELAPALERQTLGRTIVNRTDIVHGDDAPLATLLRGRRVRRVHRRAKRLTIDLDPDATLIFHLGMSGRLTLVPRRRIVESHTHVRIAIVGSRLELRFRDPRRFGGVWCFTGAAKLRGKKLGPLGPEPLELRLGEFRHLLKRRRQIKALLLDQQAIAGLGNIYCDESLHAAGIHPLTRADDVPEDRAARLLRSIKLTLRNAIRHKGTTLLDYRQPNGEPGSFRGRLRVYQRDGQKCHLCGTVIHRIIAAGRSTFVCPCCQGFEEP